jgi:hypothetical protein
VLDFARRVKSGACVLTRKKHFFFLAECLNDSRLPTATSIANLKREIGQLYDVGARYFW